MSAVILASVFVLGACGEPENASLCTAFDDYVEMRVIMSARVDAIDETQETAGEAIEAADDYLASVNRLQHAADGRYGQMILDLENAVSDVRFTLQSVQDDADYETWAPLVEDDIEAAREAAQRVEQAITPSCGGEPDSSDATPSSEPSEN